MEKPLPRSMKTLLVVMMVMITTFWGVISVSVGSRNANDESAMLGGIATSLDAPIVSMCVDCKLPVTLSAEAVCYILSPCEPEIRDLKKKKKRKCIYLCLYLPFWFKYFVYTFKVLLSH